MNFFCYEYKFNFFFFFFFFGGGGARVSELFYKESKSKRKKIFYGGEGERGEMEVVGLL